MTIRVIDIETTGFDPEDDMIVEIGSIDIDPTFNDEDGVSFLRLGNKQETLVNPKMPIPPVVSAVHHIIDSDVADAPDIGNALPPFLGAEVYVAHNAKFDSQFLPDDFKWACTYKAAVRTWPDAPGHSNQVLRYWLGIHEIPGFDRAGGQTHRALYDACVTAQVLLRLLDLCSIEDMVSWAASPMMLPKLRFGKHAGKPMKDVPGGYLNWILGQPPGDFDEDIVFTARQELRRR